MAGGSIFPYSQHPDANGRVYPNPHIGGSNSRVDFGMGVQASLGADSIWYLRFQVPEVLPSGTATLKLVAVANATSGAAKVNPKWVSLDSSSNENPDQATYNAEGTTTITWAAGNNDDYMEATVTLDADTVVAGEIIAMDLTFETTSWTLAQVSTWWASIYWA